MNKELFDKMLRAAILNDRINYAAGLMTEIDKYFNYDDSQKAFPDFRRSICQELLEQKNSLGVEPLTYEVLLKEEIQDAHSRIPLMSGEHYDWNAVWQQRRYEIAKEMMPAVYLSNREDRRTAWNDSLPPEEIAKNAVSHADALVKELRKKTYGMD